MVGVCDGGGLRVGLWGRQRYGGMYGVLHQQNMFRVGVRGYSGDECQKLCPLTIAEFQYNNHIHSATQNIPFLLDTGQIPHIGFELDQWRSNVESVNEFKE